jgi:hypothetical protein
MPAPRRPPGARVGGALQRVPRAVHPRPCCAPGGACCGCVGAHRRSSAARVAAACAAAGGQQEQHGSSRRSRRCSSSSRSSSRSSSANTSASSTSTRPWRISLFSAPARAAAGRHVVRDASLRSLHVRTCSVTQDCSRSARQKRGALALQHSDWGAGTTRTHTLSGVEKQWQQVIHHPMTRPPQTGCDTCATPAK